ncbi:unnamed protein product [Fraxinus pennsylvanica]|uniref:Uncharacterized protein n=1 Tax=Fraxinus pennsylvanica TaxID=56036 RepID=A0AAD1ZEA0_9LAMI|nr:unnamed protein product [Fraxinus pennsylvanica]
MDSADVETVTTPMPTRLLFSDTPFFPSDTRNLSPLSSAFSDSSSNNNNFRSCSKWWEAEESAKGEKGPVAVSKPPPPKQDKKEVEEVGVLPAVRARHQMIPSGEKQKRGRQAKGPVAAAAKPLPPPQKREKQEEEGVCFICFDGGSLVLRDRKGAKAKPLNADCRNPFPPNPPTSSRF